jgi:hypothetical protein
VNVKRAVVVALALLLAAGSVAVAEAPGDVPLGQATCRPGAEPSLPYGERPPEPGFRYGTRPIVIGCAELPSGRRFELVGYRLRHGAHTSLCIDDYDLTTGVRSGCGTNLVADGVIDATSSTRSRGRPSVVAGAVSPSMATVLIHFELDGRLREQPAALVMVRRRSLLRAIHVRKPFGRYLAEVPPRARAVSAEAHGARGLTRGLAFFPGFGNAIGEARACYSRPRIAGLRLLGPARAEATSRLRVVATYPGGLIGSIDVTVAGRSRVHADLAPSPRQDPRRFVTVPVPFSHSGTVGIDVTADGVPVSPRCGDRPVLRQSAPKTLAVRVR